jgi:hypothetical protein
MPLATFDNLTTWTPAITALHQAAQVIGRIQATLLPPRKNAAHLTLLPQPFGLSTQTLPDGSRFDLAFDEAMVYHMPAANEREEATFRLYDHTQVSLLKAIQDYLGLTEIKNPASIIHETPLDAKFAMIYPAYREVQYAAFTGIARFRARLGGMFSQVAIFPHHFDISTLIFHPSNTEMDESKKHINVGFAPFTEGQYERPYLYAYASPVTYPADFQPPALPKPAIWNAQGWQGAVINWKDIAGSYDPSLQIEEYCMTFYEALLPLLG